MGRMGKHIHGLNGNHLIVSIKVGKVAGLSGRIATHVYYTLGLGPQYGLYHIGMHAGSWWVGDDHIWAPMLGYKVVGEYVLHVAGVEKGVLDAVYI